MSPGILFHVQIRVSKLQKDSETFTSSFLAALSLSLFSWELMQLLLATIVNRGQLQEENKRESQSPAEWLWCYWLMGELWQIGAGKLTAQMIAENVISIYLIPRQWQQLCVCHPIRWANLLAFVTIVGIFFSKKKRTIGRRHSFHFLEYHR